MEKFLLWLIFVPSLVLAFFMLNDAQRLDLSSEDFRMLMVGGSIAAAFTMLSGIALALKTR